MNKVKIITDSCCSLSEERLKELGIDFIAMDITVDGQSYNSFKHPLLTEPEKFYEILEKSGKCSTSCINTYTFTEMFEKYLKEGFDVFYIGLSGGMSCTNNNAKIAASELNEKYGKRVFVGDSLTGSYTISLMLERAVEMAKEGKSAEEIWQALDNNGLRTFAIFAPGDLHFLTRSGRISKFVASIGSMLKIVPIIGANEKGELKLISKCLGRKKALASIQNYLLEHGDRTTPGKIIIGHTGQKEEAEQLARFVKENTQNKEVVVDYIDFTMGCNCGPKTIALFGFLK